MQGLFKPTSENHFIAAVMNFKRVFNERINTVTKISVKLEKNENCVNYSEIMFLVSVEINEAILVLFAFLDIYKTMKDCSLAVYSLLSSSSSSR